MKKLFLSIVLLSGVFILFWSKANQANFAEGQSLNCGTDELMEQLFQEQPQLRSLSEKMEEEWVQHQRLTPEKVAPPPYIIPVVFHLIHDNGPENISDATVLAGLNHLNQAYANSGYYDQDTGFVTQIQFCLAKRDPDGNPTTGINRINSALTEMNSSTQDLALKDLIRWQPTQYMNVWLVREICNNNGCGVAGYAYLPSAHGSTVDGIVMEARFLGSSEANSAVLIHEAGHYLGLRHTFQGGCVNDDCLVDGDRVCDTPPDQSTAPVPCGGTANSCTTDANSGFTTDQNDMYINYMDYGNFECYSAFTQGQSERMWFFIDGIRSSLLDSPACLDPCPSPITALFDASALSIEAGGTISFTNNSTNGDTYSWKVDGVPFASTLNTTYTFNTIGSFDITLEVSSNNPECFTQSFSVQIEVFCPVQSTFTYPAIAYFEGDNISFNGQTTAATTYNWTIDGLPVGNLLNLDFTFDQAGIFQVCLEATNAFCGATYCAYVFVDQLDNPQEGPCGDEFFFAVGIPDEDEEIGCLLALEDGGFIAGGYQGIDAWLLWFDANGTLEKRKKIPLSSQRSRFQSIKLDREGYLVGIVNTDVINNLNYNFIFKYDLANDQFLWLKRFDENVQPQARLYDFIQQPQTDQYMLFGETQSSPSPGLGCDALRLVLDQNTGNVVDQTSYNLGSCETFQKTILYDNALYHVGRYSLSTNGPNYFRAAVTKADLDGNEIWTRLYLVGLFLDARLYANDIIPEGDTLTIVAYGDLDGISTSAGDLFIFQTDLDGNMLQAKRIDIPGVSSEASIRLQPAPGGYYLLAKVEMGGQRETVLLKFRTNLSLEWAKKIGGAGEEDPRDLVWSSAYLYAVGRTTSFSASSDGFIARLTTEGEISSDCIYTEPLQVLVTNLDNPYDGLHPLQTYNQSLALISANAPILDAVGEVTAICSSPCPEICDNGIDDDGDGLVDCFDEDCFCTEPCDQYYYSGCEEDCVVEPPTGALAVQRKWTYTGGDWDEYSVPITGDLDGDGIPEVIGKMGPHNPNMVDGYRNMLIVNGEDGSLQEILPTASLRHVTDAPAIADVDQDGIAEIFIISSGFYDSNNERRIVAYKDFGSGYSLFWVSDSPVGYDANYLAAIPSVADFNGDGRPEIYVSNQIFDSFTGQKIAEAGAAFNQGFTPAAFLHSISVAADLLPDDFCPNCKGLELIAGGQVFSVAIDATNLVGIVNLETTAPIGDGYPALADLDLDGDVDAIITTVLNNTATVTSWDIQNQSDITASYSFNSPGSEVSQVTIGNLDDDDLPEIVVTGAFKLIVLDWQSNNTLALKWQRTTDDISGQTRSVLFDFNNDGKQSVIYRDQGNLYILDGENGNVLFSEVCLSGTSWENPVIVDVDHEGSAELLCSCGNELRAYESASFAWPSTRPVWNQHTYFNVNIEDDLSIPVQQQQHHLVQNRDLNLFMAQYADPAVALPDAAVEVDSLNCSEGELLVYLQVCNLGDEVLSDLTPIIVYDNDPRIGPANALTSGLLLGESLQPDSCLFMTISLPLLNNEYHVVVNDDGSLMTPYEVPEDFPVTAFAECDYLNNIRGFTFAFSSPALDLGPDLEICENGIFTLQANTGFFSYTWQDGSTEMTFTGFEPGTYWVEVLDECGFAQSDTVIVSELNVPVLNIGQDTTICPGDTICLIASGFDYYQWFPPGAVDCPDCDTVKIVTDTALLVRIVGSTEQGCISVDSVQVNISGEIFTQDTLGLCPGDTLDVFGIQVTTPGTFIDTLSTGNCLTIATIEVLALDTVLTTEELSICEGDSILLFNEWISTPGEYSGLFTSVNGCDSTHLVQLVVLSPVFTFDTLVICEGDSVLIFDEYQSQSGDYEMVFDNSVGCDSTHTITLELLPLSFGSDTLSICQGDSVLIFDEFESMAGLYSATFTAANGCDSLHETTLELITTFSNFDTLNICAGDSILIFGNWQSAAGDYTENYTSETGCDSIVTITLNLLEPTFSEESLVICSGDSTLIFGNYESNPGTYTAVFTGANGCDSTHSILLETETITLDYSILAPCTDRNNGVAVIIAEGGQEPYSYAWLPGGDIGPIVENISQGTYSVTVTDAIGCQDSITFSIDEVEPETFDFVANRPGCFGDQDASIQLVGTPGMEFSLDGVNFQAVDAFYDLGAGEYLVISQDQNGCRDTLEVVIEDPEPVWVSLPEDQTILLGETVTINSQSNVGPMAMYLWKPIDSLSCADCPNTIAGPVRSTLYTLTVLDENGCSDSDDIRITVDRRRRVYFPNAFSPNGDGVNDSFTAFGDTSVRLLRQLKIFDRWGELVFEINNKPLNDLKLGWDGRLKGKLLNPGVFVYLAEVEFVDGETEIYEGDVLLVR